MAAKHIDRFYDLVESFRAYKYRRLANYQIGDGYKRIYLFHIQKTAGTSLNHIFLSLGGEDPAKVYARLGAEGLRVRRTISGRYVYSGWDKKIIAGVDYFYAFSHTPMHKLKIPPDTFTITCFRDPKQRVLSLYKEFLIYKTNNIDHPYRKYSDAWLGNSFGEFLKLVPKTELVQQLYMFSKNLDVQEAFDNISLCSYHFRTENFEAGCADLSLLLNLPIKPIHMRKAKLDINFSGSDLAVLESILEPEYRLLEKLKK